MIKGTTTKIVPLWLIKLDYDSNMCLSLVRHVSNTFYIYQFIVIKSGIITYDDNYIEGFEDIGVSIYAIY